MTFRKQLMIILFMFAVIPTLVVGAAGMIVAVARAESTMRDGITTLVDTSGKSLDAQIEAQKREISLAASNAMIVQYLSDAHTSGENAKSIDVFLRDWVNSDADYDDAVITDKNGVIVRGYKEESLGLDISGEDYIKEAIALNEPYVSNVTGSVLNGRNAVIAISRQVVNESGEIVGVAVLYAGPGFFEGVIDGIKIGKNGYAFLTDANSIIIYHPEERLIGHPNAVLPLSKIMLDYSNGIGEREGSFVSEFEGTNRILFYYILDDISWVLLFRQPLSEFHAARNITMIVMTVAAFACMVLALVLGRSLANRVSEPINVLSNVFSQVSEHGEYQVCHIDGDGEFVALAENYNAMTARINSYNSVLEDIAYHDPLTGLGNWAAIENKLNSLLAVGETGGVIKMDVDDFKDINEMYSRGFGNETLRGLSERISSDSLGFDICARTGGDEFYLLKKGTGADVMEAVKALFASFSEPFIVNDVVVELTVSLGIALFPENGDTFESVRKNAEIAIYKAKTEGKNRFYFFDEKMRESVDRHNDITAVLKNCIAINSLFLVYQPEVDPKTGKIRAFESLMRVNDPELGFLSPSEFMPIAESTGLVIKLGAWALEEACRFAKFFCGEHKDFDNISVNVSAIQLLERSYVSDVVGTLRRTGLSPGFLQLEITESTLIRNMKDTMRKLEELRAIGVTIAMDDFGTSYSSFNYLTNLPIDTLKIDKSFIDNIITDKKRKTVTKTIINMAHDMKLRVVAEGVEESGQLEILKTQGCDLIQGYFYSKPLSGPEALKIMNSGGVILK